MGKININGGLTLVVMPGFENLAKELKVLIKLKKPYTAVDIAIPEFGERDSGEPFVRLSKDHIGGHDCVILTSGPGTCGMLIQLQMALGYMAGRRARRVAIVTGYMPLTRSDKDEGELELALIPWVVHMLKSAAIGPEGSSVLNRIIVADLHASQESSIGGMGFITPVSLVRRLLLYAVREIYKLHGKGCKICMGLPDEGAYKRSEYAIKQVCKELNIQLPIVFAQKRRANSSSTKIIGVSGKVDCLKGSILLSLDDELATGSSLMDIARVLIDDYQVKNFYGAVVHGVLCDPAPSLLLDEHCPIEKLFITDTILPNIRPELKDLLNNGKIGVLSWISDLATIIHRHHWDKNIRDTQ